MGFIHNTAKTKHSECGNGTLHLMTPIIQDSSQCILQRTRQPSWILGSSRAKTLIRLREVGLASVVLKIGHCASKSGEMASISVQLVKYNVDRF